MKDYKSTKYCLLFFLLYICFLFYGCASVDIPNKGSQNDTLVVIPLLVIPAPLNFSEVSPRYRLTVENVDTGKTHVIEIRTDDDYYIFVKKLPPGKFHIRDYETSLGFLNQNRYPLTCNKYLIVQEGKLTICPYKIAVAAFNDNTYEYSGLYYMDVIEIKPLQMKLIQEYLSRFENYSKWDL